MPFSPGRRVLATTLMLLGSSLVGLLGGEHDAFAYCRTTTLPLPANYSPTRGCFTDGLFLYWRNACVSYSINSAASRTIPFEDAKRVIDASFATWMSSGCQATGEAAGIAVSNAGAAACAKVRYNPDSANQNLIVFRDDGWPYSDPNSTLGLTTVTFNADTGEIFDADLEINSSGRNLSTTDQVPANGFDLASVVTHEAGHFFGLAHATDAKSTMYASYKPGTIALRTLTADDVEGLCAIYPNATTRIVSPVPSQNQPETIPATACDPNPRHGLASACTTPPPEEKCSLAPSRHASSAGGGGWYLPTSVGLGMGVMGMIVARRRRRARREEGPTERARGSSCGQPRAM